MNGTRRHPQYRAVGIGPEADDCAQWGKYQREGDHHRDQPGMHAEFDDHHPVQGADQQNQRHADRNLEQRQTDQPAERQFRRHGVGERQEARIDPHPFAGKFFPEWIHTPGTPRVTSRPWDM